MKTRDELFASGAVLMERFCEINRLSVPSIEKATAKIPFATCAYYRASNIVIHVPSCAPIGVGGAAWSFPGYFIDRTPYGVLQHELGHHADLTKGFRKGKYSSEFSSEMRAAASEEKLTNYCPNDSEWFAEMFRLYVTNPGLLELIRPRTFGLMSEHFKPAESRPWDAILSDAPARVFAQVERRRRESVDAVQLDLIGGAK